jgi:hypothetical protein
LLIEKIGFDVSGLPLSAYCRLSLYSTRTNALDRFRHGEIRSMMERAGLSDIRFSEREPYSVACGKKLASA